MPDGLTADPNLRTVLDRIVDAYDPERVFLFGSRARGSANDWSDYDLVAVIPDDTPSYKLHPVWLSERILDVPFPVDFFPCRTSAFEEAKHSIGTLSQVVQNEGRLVYERR